MLGWFCQDRICRFILLNLILATNIHNLEQKFSNKGYLKLLWWVLCQWSTISSVKITHNRPWFSNILFSSVQASWHSQWQSPFQPTWQHPEWSLQNLQDPPRSMAWSVWSDTTRTWPEKIMPPNSCHCSYLRLCHRGCYMQVSLQRISLYGCYTTGLDFGDLSHLQISRSSSPGAFLGFHMQFTMSIPLCMLWPCSRETMKSICHSLKSWQ